MMRPLRLVPGLLLLLLSRPAPAPASTVVTHLPGFDGPLPFYLETGYVGVEEDTGAELFYYFVESERSPGADPVLLWLTGGPRCSGFSGLAFEVGPVKYVLAPYDGGLPQLVYNPLSWTKMASIVFLDSPVCSGFSYARDPEGCDVGDYSSSLQVQRFLIKWFTDHPQYLSNPFYIGGDSYAGKVVPLIAQYISEGIEGRQQPVINLKGYLVGNPITDPKFDENFQVPAAHGFGIISDQIYEAAMQHCKGDYVNPVNQMCAEVLQTVNSQTYGYYLSYFWMNNKMTRDALGIKQGTVSEWKRCKRELPYPYDMPSSIPYHINLTMRGYRALVYSGDHDLQVPQLSTQAWIRSLNFSIVNDWRAWHLNGQAAGFTIAYANNLTFATIKGGGHTAPEYQPEECFAMAQRWLANEPL
ncbi:unnamed protein product [Triticum turgidum subsp. durum]|uniref:Serine carboxypeptidase-like 7 n=1 Tax=Triticum turgidum subsp. durum TaxID=4567 RepID=A0A9R1BVQ2_TRITD|nr:unnamed protein product [Triticum turgidum subsp. durum]